MRPRWRAALGALVGGLLAACSAAPAASPDLPGVLTLRVAAPGDLGLPLQQALTRAEADASIHTLRVLIRDDAALGDMGLSLVAAQPAPRPLTLLIEGERPSATLGGPVHLEGARLALRRLTLRGVRSAGPALTLRVGETVTLEEVLFCENIRLDADSPDPLIDLAALQSAPDARATLRRVALLRNATTQRGGLIEATGTGRRILRALTLEDVVFVDNDVEAALLPGFTDAVHLRQTALVEPRVRRAALVITSPRVQLAAEHLLIDAAQLPILLQSSEDVAPQDFPPARLQATTLRSARRVDAPPQLGVAFTPRELEHLDSAALLREALRGTWPTFQTFAPRRWGSRGH